MLTTARYAFGVVATVVLAGCSSNWSLSSGLGTTELAVQQSAVIRQPLSTDIIARTTRAGIVQKIHLDRGKSWMNPDASKQTLLYASDHLSGTVDVYNYKTASVKLYGQLTGFGYPYGECADSSGNVYIADFNAADIIEYAHGGTSPIKSLEDSYGFPIGCSVDATTGNLAVSTYSGFSGSGGIVVYSHASGAGIYYTDPNLYNMWPPGYDNDGNLFVEGLDTKGVARVGELPRGRSTFVTLLLLGATIGFPAGVQWDGKFVAFADQNYNDANTTAIYRATVLGSIATVVTTTNYTDNCYENGKPNNDVVQPLITGTTAKMNTVVGGNLWCDGRFDFWSYANGANPERTLRWAPESGSGQTVSKATMNT